MSASEKMNQEFLIESSEGLSRIEEILLEFGRSDSEANSSFNPESVNELYRIVHTMKGSAGFLGHKNLQDLTHSAENLLDIYRERQVRLDQRTVQILEAVFDLCQVMFKSIETSGSAEQIPVQKVVELVEKQTGFLNQSEVETDVAETDTSESDNNVADGHEDGLEDLIAEHQDRVESKTSESIIVSDETVDCDSIHRESTETESSPTESSPEQAHSASSADSGAPDINAAALESLKELVSNGSMDSGILEDLESGKQAEPKPEEKSETDTGQTATSSMSRALPAVDPLAELTPKKAGREKAPQEQKADGQTNQNVENINNLQKVDQGDITNNFNKKTSITDSIVRVNVEVLDKIMGIVGELVLNRNQIVQLSGKRNDNEFTRVAQQLNGITSELQREVMSTRMQPIGNVLSKFERLVRDLSRSFDKKINLKLSGQETELDKTLLEAIKDPLVHIIRNAADHGIETRVERDKTEKPASATITIKSYNESGQVTVEISDDGRGINAQKVLNKAIEKGVISESESEKLTDGQIYGLIFAPGFSTADKVTNVSGRGVGMDVVKTNIEKIGGSVSIHSKFGEGTTFKLKIPLTLAIVPALLIQSANEYFAIPQLNLVELVKLTKEDQESLVEYIGDAEFLRLRGELTPIFRVNNILRLEELNQKRSLLGNGPVNTELEKTNVIDNDEASELDSSDQNSISNSLSDEINVVIVEADNRQFGLVVDEILDTEEIVVKPLNLSESDETYFGGATIMGDGRVALILDVMGFAGLFESDEKSFFADEVENGVDDSLLGDQQETLLVELNDQQVYAVPLCLVNRLEEFSPEDFQTTGNITIVRYLDQPMPILNVESTLGLELNESPNEIDGIENINGSDDKIKCIVVRYRDQNFGFVVKRILDIATCASEIDDSVVDRVGLLGTINFDERIITVLDIYKIIDMQSFVEATDYSRGHEDVSNRKILLADDSSFYRKMESDALRERGYQVVVTENGEEAVRAFQSEEEFDLVVTDIEMPVMDGYELARKIKELNASIPVIAISTRVGEKDRQKGLSAGFDHHLEKFKRDEVINIVDQVLKAS